MALGADQAQQPHEIVGARRSRWDRPTRGTPPGAREPAVGCLAGGLVCRRLPRSLTSLGGLVPARRRAQTQALSASVGRPGRPFPPSRPRSTPKARPPWQASPQARNSASPAAPPDGGLPTRLVSPWTGLTHRVSWRHRCQVPGAVVLTGHAISGATSGPRSTGSQRTTPVTIGHTTAQLTEQTRPSAAGHRDRPAVPDTEEAMRLDFEV